MDTLASETLPRNLIPPDPYPLSIPQLRTLTKPIENFADLLIRRFDGEVFISFRARHRFVGEIAELVKELDQDDHLGRCGYRLVLMDHLSQQADLFFGGEAARLVDFDLFDGSPAAENSPHEVVRLEEGSEIRQRHRRRPVDAGPLLAEVVPDGIRVVQPRGGVLAVVALVVLPDVFYIQVCFLDKEFHLK